MPVIDFAEKRYKECCDNEEYEDARYWAAYLDGARAQKKEKAEPVKHGRWLWDGKHYYCSVCGGTRYHDLVLGMDAAYCPYCGAKLEGVEDGTK